MGHNVGFDMAFLYDSFQKYLGRPLQNDSLDHLRIAREAFAPTAPPPPGGRGSRFGGFL